MLRLKHHNVDTNMDTDESKKEGALPVAVAREEESCGDASPLSSAPEVEKAIPASSSAASNNKTKKYVAIGLVVVAIIGLSVGLGVARGGNQGTASSASSGSGVTLESFVTEGGCSASCDDTTGICTYTALVDLYASEFGYYHFAECPDAGTMPSLALELGKTYRFIQTDVTNYFHPLGFAYAPDGALAGADELDEALYLNYQLNGEEITLEGGYEPQFGWPIDEWATNGEYYVDVTLPINFDAKEDLFYFCHIHRYFGGRIKLVNDGQLLHPEDAPVLTIVPPPPSDYDIECGTFGLVMEDIATGSDGTWPHSMPGDYRTPSHPQCPHAFVCETGKSTFATCLEAINCHMFKGMTTNENHDETVLFLHQMIPHHQNAVNMAKSLLFADSEEQGGDGYLDCPKSDLGGAGSSLTMVHRMLSADPALAIPCTMVNLLRSIINGQNAQIQTMRGLLEDGGYPEFDMCDRTGFEGSTENADETSFYDSSIDMNGYWGYNKSTVDTIATASAVARNSGPRMLQDDVTATETTSVVNEPEICRATCETGTNGTEICTFTVKLDFFASDLGAFYFEECGADNPFPIIGIEIGKQYVFDQSDITNFYHPLGFAYHPDGAHVGLPELEEDPYLQYMLNGEVVGLEPMHDSMGYEPLFFHSPDEWWDYGEFSVGVKFDKEYEYDLFYFCHIHHGMSGRIKLLKDSVPISAKNFPLIAYRHPQPSDYDKGCGTYEMSPYQLPHPECPESFICDKSSEFAGCLDTMNCYMMAGMTSHANEVEGDVELFLHHMIPHHINAVNMAKALFKTGTVDCTRTRVIAGATSAPLPSSEDGSDGCILDGILRDIIGNQNYQINVMYGVLQDGGFPKSNDCVVKIGSVSSTWVPTVTVAATNAPPLTGTEAPSAVPDAATASPFDPTAASPDDPADTIAAPLTGTETTAASDAASATLTVLPTSIPTSKQPSSATAISLVGDNSWFTCAGECGPQSSMPCVFPFIYNSVLYNSCTNIDSNQEWCGTADGGWKNCCNCP